MVRMRTPWMFQDLVQELDRMTRDTGWAFGGTASVPECTACGIQVREKDAVLELELPGVAESDLTLELEGNRLTVSARREDLHEDAEEVLLRERTYGEYHRSYRLPWAVREEDVDARLQNGVLTLHLTRAPEDAPRRIQINAAS